jgi:UDP-glucose 4-epimerase
MQNRQILVTGGGGFIGSNLANHLAEDNDVIAVDDGYLGTPANLSDNVRYVESSVLDTDFPAVVDVVFHLAALSTRSMHHQHPQRGCRVNVEGFVNTIEQAKASGCDTVVYVSSSSIYGDHTEPTTESMTVEAETAYQASKLACERYAEYYAHHHDMSMAGLRFFSVYQGFGDGDEYDREYHNTIDRLARKITSGEPPELFGDGSQTRDFVHDHDVARACELAADHEVSGIYNVGTGDSHSFNEVVEMINETAATDIDPKYIECPFDGYLQDMCADVSKFRQATGWEPTIGLERGIELVCEPYLS